MDRKKVKDALIQLMLRMIPLLPGNEMKQLFDALTKSETDLGEKVREAVKSLEMTSILVADLEESLKSKTAGLSRLQEEYKKYENMTAITREQVKSIADVLETTIERNRTKELITAIMLHTLAGFIFLVLGVLLAHPIENTWASFMKKSEATTSPTPLPKQK
jgi:hypothetical protein